MSLERAKSRIINHLELVSAKHLTPVEDKNLSKLQILDIYDIKKIANNLIMKFDNSLQTIEHIESLCDDIMDYYFINNNTNDLIIYYELKSNKKTFDVVHIAHTEWRLSNDDKKKRKRKS